MIILTNFENFNPSNVFLFEFCAMSKLSVEFSCSGTIALHKICENMGFHWPAYSHMKIKYTILSLYGNIRVTENLYSRIFYAVILYLITTTYLDTTYRRKRPRGKLMQFFTDEMMDYYHPILIQWTFLAVTKVSGWSTFCVLFRKRIFVKKQSAIFRYTR